MHNICLFAGTTEGRKLATFLSKQDISLTVFVATEYGKTLLTGVKNINVQQKRLTVDEMAAVMKEKSFDIVIDATHPYAAQVTKNIIAACEKTNTPYYRLLRNESRYTQDVVTVSNNASAVDWLNQSTGNILLTTGSKELQSFASINDFSDRVYARVLPTQDSIKACTDAGLKPSHIIAMQGPFSEEINIAQLHSINAKWLVTKDGGDPGGFDAKISAAEKTGANLLVIGRPVQHDGYTESELIDFLCQRYHFTFNPVVKIVGIGPGNKTLFTQEVLQAIESADCLIGAKRMLQSVCNVRQKMFEAIDSQTISDYIHNHKEHQSYTVLMSGDSSFYSGTKRLLPLLQDCETKVLPGVSSLSYLCSKLNISSENIKTVSLHGKTQDIIPEVRSNRKLFLLTGGTNTVNSICQTLLDNGLGELYMIIGENLSYKNEVITKGPVKYLANRMYGSLAVILIENDHPDMVITHGLPDSVFKRSSGEKGIIPMTKSEIRSICLSKLGLMDDSVCWDIGSGTGSVSIEMALQSKNGHVYAIERDPEAVLLSKENAARLHVSNLDIIEGDASEICSDLPTPTHVFIGGCSGKIDEIISLLFSRKSEIKIAVTAVTLETIAELNQIIHCYDFSETDVVLVQTSQGKELGSHHLFLGGNPVYIFSMHISG